MTEYENWDRATLDRAYNNSEAVPHAGTILADWQARSAAQVASAAARPGDRMDIAYGAAPRQRLDWFAGPDGAPALIFVHGGYWQGQVKESYRFLAEGARAAGLHFALLEYTLAPEASMTAIVAEIGQAIDWLAAHAVELKAGPLLLSGHSAGGHLTAQWLEHPAIVGGLAISGIFELDPIRRGMLNDKLQLTEEEVERFSPQRHIPDRSKPLVVTVGLAELPELVRHSRDYLRGRNAKGLATEWLGIEERNHFDILEDLARPGGALIEAVRGLAR